MSGIGFSSSCFLGLDGWSYYVLLTVFDEIDKHLFQKVSNSMNQNEEDALMGKIEGEEFNVSITMAKTAILMANTNKALGLFHLSLGTN